MSSRAKPASATAPTTANPATVSGLCPSAARSEQQQREDSQQLGGDLDHEEPPQRRHEHPRLHPATPGQLERQHGEYMQQVKAEQHDQELPAQARVVG